MDSSSKLAPSKTRVHAPDHMNSSPALKSCSAKLRRLTIPSGHNLKWDVTVHARFVGGVRAPLGVRVTNKCGEDVAPPEPTAFQKHAHQITAQEITRARKTILNRIA